jgi:hypothetical protein
MAINIKLLDKCPVLTPDQKELVKRVDINHETLSSIAKSHEKTTSTICIQHKKALQKLTSWMRDMEGNEAPAEGDFSKKVFRMFRRGKLPDAVIAEVGRADEVISLWRKYLELKEGDYYNAQRKISECGYDASGDSDYPLCEQVDFLIEEKDMLLDEEEEVREVLEKQGVKAGEAFGGYGSISDGVQRLGDKLFQTQQVLVSVNQQKEDLRERLEDMSKQLEETTNKLSNTEKTLDDERLKVTRLLRLEKYENLSEEKRKSLQDEIEMARRIVSGLNKQVGELHLFKVNLEKEVDWLKQNKQGAIDTLMQVKVDVKKDFEDSMLEILGNLQLNDVLELYNTALKRKIYKIALPQ